MSVAESEFILSSLKPTHKVLEWGSGFSTIEIAKRVKSVLSIEHQKKWYDQISNDIPSNVNLILKQPNLEYVEGGHCGTYEQFKDYIEYPIQYSPFNVIIIDGRARPSCASICNKIANKNSIIFVHDFTESRINSDGYGKIYDYLEKIDNVETMFKFKIKKK